MKWQLLVPLLLIIFFILPSIIAGEIVYGWSRNQQYEDLEGFEKITLQIKKNLALQIWYTNSASKVILVIHGHNDHSAIMNDRYGKLFQDMGYDLVFLDLRNHGRSGKDKPVTLGIKESWDVAATLEWISKNQWEEIVLYGTSMGGIAALLGHNLTKIADKVILDSIFLDFEKVLDGNFRKNHIPHPWRWLVINYLVKIRFGNNPQPNITKILKEQKAPFLILHGNEDRESPVDVISKIESLNKSNIETQIIEGGTHSKLFQHDEFIGQIRNFLEVSRNS